MNSSQINENLTKAVDIILNKRLSQLKYDQTIIAEIAEIVNEEEGQYKIKYQSVLLNVWNENLQNKYKVGQSVYIKIPQSDFSKKLLIESKVGNEQLTENQIKNLKNYKTFIQPYFDYEISLALTAGPTQLIGKEGVNPQFKQQGIFISLEEDRAKQFKELAKQYEVLYLEATFKNSLINFHSKGNYGLKFNFLTIDDIVQTFTIDTSKFTGNFYTADSYGSKQGAYFQFEKGKLKTLLDVEFFQEGMEQDRDIKNPIYTNTINGQVKDYPNVITDNLFVENISIRFCDVANLLSEEEYLHLDAPSGFVFLDGGLTFTAQLLKKGENVINTSEYSTFWYERKNNEENKNRLGNQWIILNSSSNDSLELKQLNTENKVQEYKVVVYNSKEEEIASKNFYVYPQGELFLKPEITQTRAGDTVILSLPDGYEAIWYFNDNKQGTGQQLELQLKDFQRSLVAKVDAEISDWGVITLDVPAPLPITRAKVTFDGKTDYHYDAFGYLFEESARQEKVLRIGIVSDEEVIEPFLYINNIEIKEGKENKINPINSNLENIYYKVSNTGMLEIYYNLKNKFNQKNKNNQIRIELGFKDGIIETYYCNFHFSLLGDLGNNGSNYACYLSAISDNIDINKFIINLEVYADGYKVNDIQNYEVLNLKLNDKDYLPNLNVLQQIVVHKEDIINNSINYLVITVYIKGETITNYFGVPSNFSDVNPKKTYVKYNFKGEKPQSDGDISSAEEKFNFNKANGKNYYFNMVNNYPVIYYRNLYSNEALTEWQGGSQFNEIHNTALAEQYIAGEKTSNIDGTPKLSGIILGDIKDDTNKEKGIYGYKDNNEIFGLSIDGKGFIGKIQFNKNNQEEIQVGETKILNNNIQIGENTKISNEQLKTNEVQVSSFGDLYYINADDQSKNTLQDIIDSLQRQINELRNAISDLQGNNKS